MNISEHLKHIKNIMYENQTNEVGESIINEQDKNCTGGGCTGEGEGTKKDGTTELKGTFKKGKLVKGLQQYEDGSFYKYYFEGDYDKCGSVTYTTPGGFTTPKINTKYWPDGNCRAEGWKDPKKTFRPAANKWTQKSNCVSEFKGATVIPWNNDDSILIRITLGDGSYISFFDTERFVHFNSDGTFFKGDKKSSTGSIKCK